MTIQWLGYSCFKIQAKILDKEITIIINPYDASTGLKLPKMHADIVFSSYDHPWYNNVGAVSGVGGNSVFVINNPGEYEKSGVFVRGILSCADKTSGSTLGINTIYRIDVENLSVVHLGSLGHVLNTEQLDSINGVDILLLPVGCHAIDMDDVKEIVSQIDPKVIIPMHYRINNIKAGAGVKFELLDKFLNIMGAKDAERFTKLKINYKNIEKDKKKVIVLEKS